MTSDMRGVYRATSRFC